ncbi:MAG TPA: EamA family transporter [Thermoanaerobaculia bacterium]|nr:EamA family transporter [Thermoanaerobaculia bacterium]
MLTATGRPLLTYAALAALVLIWGSTWAAIRVSLEGIPPLTGVVLRFTLACLVLLALAPVFRVRLGATSIERRLWWVNAVLTFTVSYGLVYWAEQWVPSGLAAVIFATFPLFVAVLAHFFLPGERLRTASFLGVLTGFVGVAVLYSEDLGALVGPQAGFAAKVMLIAPVVSAMANVAVKRWGAGVHPFSISGVSMGLGALLVVPLAWSMERGREITFGARPVLAVVYLAVIGSAVAFTVYYWLLRRLPATRLSLINYATPVVAVLIGTLGLGEPFTLRILIGTGLVVVGVAISMR